MGMFGSACGRCWDKDCNCTEEQLIEYNKQCQLNRNVIREVEYSKTEPKVCAGDVIVKGLDQYFVRKIVNGVAKVTLFSNDTYRLIGDLNLCEPYCIIVSSTWK